MRYAKFRIYKLAVIILVLSDISWSITVDDNIYKNTTIQNRMDKSWSNMRVISQQKQSHPLDPLTPHEIIQTSKIINKKYYPKKWWFEGITLKEPNKSLLYPILMSENNGLNVLHNNIPRKSFSVVHEMGSRTVYEAIVNLNTNNIESFKQILTQNIYSTLSQLEITQAITNIKKNEQFQKRIMDQGYTVDTIYLRFQRTRDKYKCYFVIWGTDAFYENLSVHPFGFIVVVEFGPKEGEIISISFEEQPVNDQFTVRNNNSGVNVPKRPLSYDPNFPGFPENKLRDDIKPLILNFPNGPSYTIDGNIISWQKFKFRIGYNYREGLVLHNIIYQDKNKVRPLFYRVSVSELSTLYGDPRTPYYLKQVFDEGWFGLGNPPNSLVDGKDCIGATTFFNATISQPDGSFMNVPNAICISEEDDGILWKHTSQTTGKVNIARSRKLTVSQITTIANYDYLFSWYFYQDATISFEVEATGIVFTRLLAKGATPFGYGTIVFPQINAQYHQHLLAARIDPMIDGKKNTVSTLDIIPVQGDTGSSSNPYGNGFTTKETILKNPSQARTNISPSSARVWKISNEKHIHPYTNQPVSYKLIPMSSPPMMMKMSSPYNSEFGYGRYSIWVTPYKDGQVYAAGYYCEGNGLPEWVQKMKYVNIKNKDVVLWHTFNFVHIPRVEDFPVMPYERKGFSLKPYNFFLYNPAVDVP